MRRVLLICAAAALLAACRPGIASPTATALLPVEPSSTAAAPASALFFDSFDMMDARKGWAWKGVSQLYRTDDGGATWTEIHLRGKMLETGASFLSGEEAWLTGVPDADLKQAVYHTADGGKTWTELGSIPGPNLELHFHDSMTGWTLNGTGAAGNVFYEVYRTMDGGSTWTHLAITPRGEQAAAPLPGALHVMTGDSVSFTPPDTIWVASGYGLSTPYAGLSVARDGGKTWLEINPPLPPEYVKGQEPVVSGPPQFVSERDAFLPVTAGARQVVFASHDGGDSWQMMPAVMPAGPMLPRVQFVNERDGFAACGTALCATHDGAVSWQQVPTPFPVGSAASGPFVRQLDFVDALTGWAILMSGQGSEALLKTTDGGHTWIRMEPRPGF